MGMQQLRQLSDNNSWAEFLKKQYAAVEEDHSGSWKSWARSRIRLGNRMDSAVGGASQAVAAGSLATGAAALPGAAGAVALTAGATAISLYAVPVTVTALAIAYWGYQKSEHHEVNKEIWKYYTANRDANDNLKIQGNADPSLEQVKKWMGWFGDEGISNINHLADKLKEAQNSFKKNFDALQSERDKLGSKMQAWQAMNPKTPQETQQKQNDAIKLGKDADALADKYMGLAKDLEYVQYRLERLFMYYEMLDLTASKLHEKMATDLNKARTDAEAFFKQNMEGYEKLWYKFDGLLLPAGQGAGAARPAPPPLPPRPHNP